MLTRAERMEDVREMRSRLLRINTTLIFPAAGAPHRVRARRRPGIFGPAWTGAVVPAQILAVAGVWTILRAGIDAPLMAVGRPGALATFKLRDDGLPGVTAWFTAPIVITAVAVGCLRFVSPPAWGDLRTLFVRVLAARRVLPTLRDASQRV